MRPRPNQPKTVPEVLTVRQVAERIHRTPAYVRSLIRTGKLRATRLCDGGRYLVYADSLSSLLGIRIQNPSKEALYREARAAAAEMGYFGPIGDGTL